MRNYVNLSFLGLFVLTGSISLLAQALSDPNQSGPIQNVGAQGNAAPALQQRYPRYKVMPSDALAISFPLSPEINQNATVQPDGFITLANVGSIYVQGQTTPQIVDTLTKAYAKVLHNPIIGVDVTNFQASQFTVLGEVGKPGQYPLRYDTTVSEGIAIAGGLLPSGKTRVFLLHRVSPDWVEAKKLNIKDIVHGKNAEEDVHLQPGDMIYVPDTVISKFRRYLPYNTGIGVSPQQLVMR